MNTVGLFIRQCASDTTKKLAHSELFNASAKTPVESWGLAGHVDALLAVDPPERDRVYFAQCEADFIRGSVRVHRLGNIREVVLNHCSC